MIKLKNKPIILLVVCSLYAFRLERAVVRYVVLCKTVYGQNGDRAQRKQNIVLVHQLVSLGTGYPVVMLRSIEVVIS